MITIYYKDNKLDRIRTAKSLLSYYMREFMAGNKPSRVIVESSLSTDS